MPSLCHWTYPRTVVLCLPLTGSNPCIKRTVNNTVPTGSNNATTNSQHLGGVGLGSNDLNGGLGIRMGISGHGMGSGGAGRLRRTGDAANLDSDRILASRFLSFNTRAFTSSRPWTNLNTTQGFTLCYHSLILLYQVRVQLKLRLAVQVDAWLLGWMGMVPARRQD